MRPSVLVTRRLFPEAEALLRRAFRITKSATKAEGALVQLTDRVDRRFFDAMPRLRVVSQCAVGVDNIDLAEAASRGIVVMNTPGVLTDATADLTWTLILAVARRIVEGDAICRAARFQGWDLEFLLGRDLSGSTLGVVGAGRIGTAVALRASAFGMKVLYHERRRAPSPPVPGARRAGFHRLLAESDVVTLHVPATPGTYHLIGRRELSLMKRTAILVNTSRGTAIDEKALIEALAKGRIWGAGLDVFEHEPRIPAALRRSPRVVLAPHIGSATRGTRGAMALTAARNLVDFFAERPDRSRVVAG